MLTDRRKARLSYADLLDLYLHQKLAGDDADIDAMATSLGFESVLGTSLQSKNQPTVNEKSPGQAKSFQTGDVDTASVPSDRPSLPFYFMVKREQTDKTGSPETNKPPALMNVPTLDDDEIFDKNAPLPFWQVLTRHAKLWSKLRQILNQCYDSNEPDISKLIKNIERGDTSSQTPFTHKQRRISKILVLADYSEHLRTARQDYHQLQQDLKNFWGEEKIIWQTMLDCPGGKVRVFQKHRIEEKKWRIPPTDTAILILSDCGCFASPTRHQQWQAFLGQIRRSGNTILVLAPASPANLVSTNLKQLHSYSWDSALPRVDNAYSQTTRIFFQKDNESIEAILTCLCFTYWIEAYLLRATRQWLNLDVGYEALCRLHEDVSDDGKCIAIKKQALQKYRDKFRLLDTEQQNHMIALVKVAHARLPRSILDYELVTVQALRPQKPVSGAEEALFNLQRFCKTFIENSQDRNMQSHVYSILEEQERGGEEAASLFVTLHGKTIEEEKLTLPKNVSLDDIAQFINIYQSGQKYSLLLGEDRIILNKDTGSNTSSFPYQFKLAEAVFTHRKVELQSKLITIDDATTIPILPNHTTQTINTGTENLTIGSITKPSWADNIGRDQQGLFIECDHLGQQFRVYYPEWGGGLGKDEYGIYHELEIHGVVQRFRYIPAGRFIMGSPKNEKQRLDDETQHEVTLTQSYWLADTACTQSLWQTVMDENPASFKEDTQNPVEQVSWNDVQAFLKKLNTLVPQLRAELPSEAQWEYACRAGTLTPFSFGENITPEQVNYDGNYPYANGQKGKDREKTVAVKALPANQWGLYQMHGNVLEWCQDWYGKYPAGSVQDPTGAKQGEDRVLRGGSWDGRGQFVRSAYRHRDWTDFRYFRIGFRLSLGQASSEAVAESQEPVASDQRDARAGAARDDGRGFIKQGMDTLSDFVKRKK